jgi:hypothetical protein
MDLDLQSLFRPMSRDLHNFTHWLRSRLPPYIWTRFTRALLVCQDRRHLLVTPWLQPSLLPLSYHSSFRSSLLVFLFLCALAIWREWWGREQNKTTAKKALVSFYKYSFYVQERQTFCEPINLMAGIRKPEQASDDGFTRDFQNQ